MVSSRVSSRISGDFINTVGKVSFQSSCIMTSLKDLISACLFLASHDAIGKRLLNFDQQLLSNPKPAA